MEFAKENDSEKIIDLYTKVIDTVNRSTVRLGWNINIYPNREFVDTAIANHEMLIIRDQGEIVAAASVNHTVNPEYSEIDWVVKGPKEKIATIHALAVIPHKQGQYEPAKEAEKTSDRFLSEIEAYCKRQGDLAIHLDVIDSNIPAYKLYTKNGYLEVDCIKMFYEVVGTRDFWMLEKII